MAEVFYLKHQPLIALKYIDSTFTNFLDFKDKNLKEKALFLKAKSLLKAKKIVEADENFKIATAYKNELLKDQLQKRYTLATVKHETKKRELELLESKQKITLDKNHQELSKTGVNFTRFNTCWYVFLSAKNTKR